MAARGAMFVPSNAFKVENFDLKECHSSGESSIVYLTEILFDFNGKVLGFFYLKS